MSSIWGGPVRIASRIPAVVLAPFALARSAVSLRLGGGLRAADDERREQSGAGRRLLHHDEARSLQVLDDPLGGDLRHVLVGLMHPLFAAIAQGESDCLGQVVRVRGVSLSSSGMGEL
jgi:hypothetical protein